MSRLREGRANTARGAAHFLRETVGRCATVGPEDSSRCGPTAASTPTPSSRSAAQWMSATPSPSASTKACGISLRRYPRGTGRRFPTGWTAPPRWPRPPTPPSRMSPTPAPVRLIVRRVKPTPGSQLALFVTYSYHGFITDREGKNPGTGGRPSPPRRDRERHSRPQVRRRTQPSPLGALRRQRRLAGGAGARPQPGTLDGAHRSGRADRDHQDPATPLLFHGRKAHPLGAPPHFASAPALALGSPVQWRPR